MQRCIVKEYLFAHKKSLLAEKTIFYTIFKTNSGDPVVSSGANLS